MEPNENFPQVVARYQDAIFRLAYSYTKNHFDADDVTQNVLLQLYKTDKAFETEAHLKNWLMCVTVNQCKNLFRAPGENTRTLKIMQTPWFFRKRTERICFAWSWEWIKNIG